MVTCWPVITETVWLLAHNVAAIQKLFTFLDDNILTLVELEVESATWFANFFEQYANLKPDFADAALLYVAERHGIDMIFTLDRDFFIYRIANNLALNVIPLLAK